MTEQRKQECQALAADLDRRGAEGWEAKYGEREHERAQELAARDAFASDEK